MRKYKIEVTKTMVYFDTIEVKASCPKDAREIAIALAKTQERQEALGECDKPLLMWSEDKPTKYKTEIVCK